MNINRLKQLCALLTLVSFASVKAKTETTETHATIEQIKTITTHSTDPSPFNCDIWKKNAELLNNAMNMNPNRLSGIKAMYVANIKAIQFLGKQKTRMPNIAPETTILERTESLLAPVQGFLPQVKALKKAIAPLIQISLNRKATEQDTLNIQTTETETTFDTSLFKKSLDCNQDINVFIKEHIKSEDDFTQLCQEFHRVFSDLLDHAFPKFKQEFESLMIEEQKKKQQLATEKDKTA